MKKKRVKTDLKDETETLSVPVQSDNVQNMTDDQEQAEDSASQDTAGNAPDNSADQPPLSTQDDDNLHETLSQTDQDILPQADADEAVAAGADISPEEPSDNLSDDGSKTDKADETVSSSFSADKDELPVTEVSKQAEPDSRQSHSATPHKNGGSGAFKSTLISLLGGAASAFAVILFLPPFIPDLVKTSELAPAVDNQTEMRGLISTLKDDLGQLTTRIHQLETIPQPDTQQASSQMEAIGDEFQQRLSAMDGAVASVKEQLSVLDARNNEFANQLQQVSAESQRIPDQSALNEFNSRLTALEAAIQQSAEQNRHNQEQLKSIAFLTLAQTLDRQVNSRQPYEELLAPLASFGVPNDTIELLRPFSSSGFPSIVQLNQELSEILTAFENNKAQNDAAPSVWGSVVSVLMYDVEAYPKGSLSAEGTDINAIAAKDLMFLQLDDALKTWNSLPEDQKQASMPWQGKIQHLIAVRDKVKTIVHDALRQSITSLSPNQ